MVTRQSHQLSGDLPKADVTLFLIRGALIILVAVVTNLVVLQSFVLDGKPITSSELSWMRKQLADKAIDLKCVS